ncbi:NAD-dependent epimerase/dehydratase family protein [Cryomorphaceae bacterium]|nr:NAD-dependent epimerase/dehydratase family protein [Cryomorphaceae bacterium]
MKISVIGGSGFIGTYLIKRLRGLGQDVVNIDKSMSTTFPEITTLANVQDTELIETALVGTDIVINLAAEHKDNVMPISLYYDVNVGGAENICKAARNLGIQKIIFTSSVAIYGLNKDNPDELFPEDPFNDYGKSKWEAEKVFENWAHESNNRELVIVRPTVVFGPNNRGNVYNLLRQIATGRFLRIGKGINQKSMAYVENLVEFIAYNCESLHHGVNIYNYVDKPDLSMNELVIAVEAAMNIKVPKIRIPYVIGVVLGYSVDLLSRITRKEFPISAVRIRKFCATTVFNAEKAHGSGFVAPFSLEEGLRKTMKSEDWN